MEIKLSKTKTMVIATIDTVHVIVEGQNVEQVTSFKYYGSLIEGNGKEDGQIHDKW